MKKRILIISSALLLLSYNYVSAQCTQVLNRAEDEFEAGRILGIPALLQECLNTNGFSKEETIRAHKLLTQVYIFSDQESKAEESMIKLLKVDPEHQLDENFDPAELFYLYEKFRVEPIFRIGVKLGGNLLTPYVINEYSAFSPEFSNRTYTSAAGFNAELSVERHFALGFEGSLGLMFRSSKYTVDNVSDSTGILSTINDAQSWAKIPLLARYNFNYGNRKGPIPYIMGGVSFDYLLKAQFVDSNRQGGTQKASNNYDLLSNEERNRINFSGFVGGGVKLRTQTHFITIEGRYEVGLLNYVNPDNRFNSNETVYGLSYVSDDLSLGFLSITVGYTRSIYNPKKKKKFINQ